MTRGVSLHVGLNSVDPNQYGGWSGELHACESDARDMASIAESAGFTATTLVTKDATSAGLLEALGDAARELTEGDILVVTASCHGGQLPDVSGDEEDGLDETWVLYDRQVVDDELYHAFSKFVSGVRIAVFSDSCHSGTVTRVALAQAAGAADAPTPLITPRQLGARSRAMPAAVAQRDYLNRRQMYVDIQKQRISLDPEAIPACVVLTSGCQDNQVSLDGTYNGLFTATLLTVWNGGAFRGDYRRFRSQIARRMPETQSPNLSVVGSRDQQFLAQRPFTV